MLLVYPAMLFTSRHNSMLEKLSIQLHRSFESHLVSTSLGVGCPGFCPFVLTGGQMVFLHLPKDVQIL